MLWKTLTYFGDSMLLIPTAVIIALILPWKSDNRRACGTGFWPLAWPGWWSACQKYCFLALVLAAHALTSRDLAATARCQQPCGRLCFG